MDEHRKLLLDSAPVLPVDNAVETADYYCEKLGFRVSATRGDPPYYIIVERDGVKIHFSEREDTSTRIQPAHVCIATDDVDTVYQQCVAKGLRMFSPPEDKDHGKREFELADKNGHFLTFSQTIVEPGV